MNFIPKGLFVCTKVMIRYKRRSTLLLIKYFQSSNFRVYIYKKKIVNTRRVIRSMVEIGKTKTTGQIWPKKASTAYSVQLKNT